MLTSEKQEILSHLNEGYKSLVLALDGVSSEEALWKPGAQAWSILECVEHLALAENGLFSELQRARPSPERDFNAAREAAILSRLGNRGKRVESPEAALPRGRFGTLEEAMAGFSAVRARTIEWIDRHQEDPRSWLTTHPLIPGPINCYEMLLMIALHPRRHAEQIRQIRSLFAPGSRPIEG